MLVGILIAFLSVSQGQTSLDSEPSKHVYTCKNSSNSEDAISNRRPVNDGPLPRYFDWRDKGAVSAVKQQLQCNACWAFSIVAAVESHLMIHVGKDCTLSEQFLIDCVSINNGCDDASLLQSYGYIVTQIGGILRSADYFRYEARQRACRWQPPTENSESSDSGINKILLPGDRISRAYPMPVVGFTRVKPDEDEMANALYRHGPLSAAINSASMNDYIGGIDEPTDEKCDPNAPTHTILIVGYNEYVPKDPTKRSVKYWIIKNSWGEEWGDKGFYYLVRGRNACGIANDVSLPFVSM